MFKPETKILFQEPTADARRLRSATVLESREEGFCISFDGEAMELARGQELICYFHGRREFMQQVVRVTQLADDGHKIVVEVAPAGDPVSAENRGAPRVSSISADLFAALGEDRNLPVHDVSSTGFAVASAAEYRIGTTLAVSLCFGGDVYSGTASVKSIRQTHSGRNRYGLRALDEGDLRDGLHQISQAMQSQQLKGHS